MDRLRGDLLGVSIPALAMGLCSIDGEGGGGEGAAGGGGGGFDGAAALLEDDGDAAGGGGDGGDAGTPADAAGDGAGASAPSDSDPEEHDGSIIDVPDFLKAFSADKGDKKLSNQEWLAKIGVKDLDDLATRYRAAEKGLREGGRIKIPGDNASDEDRAAFRQAMGVPETPDKYEVAVPTAPGIAGNFEVDKAFTGPLAEVAHANNVPAGAFKALSDKFMELQAESITAEVSQRNSDRDAYFRELGDKGDARKGEFRRGAQIMGLDAKAIARVQSGYGTRETIDMIANVGAAAGEDVFAGDNAKARFGVASSADAQAALDAMMSDPATAKALQAGTDKAAKAKWDRLTEAKAHWLQIESKKR